jgi:hypothetical protein
MLGETVVKDQDVIHGACSSLDASADPPQIMTIPKVSLTISCHDIPGQAHDAAPRLCTTRGADQAGRRRAAIARAD